MVDIKKLLQEHNITAYQLHKSLGLAYSTIFRWKNGGKISPANEKLLNIYFGKKS